MGFLDQGLGNTASACVGLTSMAFGGLGLPGVGKAAIGLAGLTGFVLAKRQKFGPECERVRGRIQATLLESYHDLIRVEGDDWVLSADLTAADEALRAGLGACFIDRRRLAQSAVTPEGFPKKAVALLLEELARREPALFGPGRETGIAYRFAHDVLAAGIHAAVEDPEYYRRLEPDLIFAMAQALGLSVEKLDILTAKVETLQRSLDSLTARQGEAAEIAALQARIGEYEAVIASLRQTEARLIAETRRFGVQDGLLVALARRYAEGSPDDFDSALAGLKRALEVAKAEAARDRLPSNLDAAVAAILSRIDALNDQGRIDAGFDLLDAELAAMAEEDTRRRAARARLYDKGVAQAILARSVPEAVRYLLLSIDLETPDPREGWDRLRQVQGEWYQRGRDKGLNFDLEVSIALARHLVDSAPGQDSKGTALNDLGVSHKTLGTRESGTEQLEQAVEALRQALEEWTRERVPLDWARIQNNLGNALQTLGERESGTARLEQAVEAYSLALEERRRDRVPLAWAMTQNNLGNALRALGERENGTSRLNEAVDTFRAALKERTRERKPLDWAMTQNNLGTALRALGERESGTERLEQAVEALRLALEEWTRDRVPLDWAGAQNNLGNALRILGERESSTERLEQAVEAFRQALEEWTSERTSHYHGMAQRNLDKVLRLIAERRGG